MTEIKLLHPVSNFTKVEIPDDVHGMLGFRFWALKGTHISPVLNSTGMSYQWNQPIATQPAPLNHENGLHAFKLDKAFLNTSAWRDMPAFGLVELRGEIIEHQEGIVRAEWARILCLFIEKKSVQVDRALRHFWEKPDDVVVQNLEKRYNCKVYLFESSYLFSIISEIQSSVDTKLLKFVGTSTDIKADDSLRRGGIASGHIGISSGALAGALVGYSIPPAYQSWSAPSGPKVVRVLSHSTPVIQNISELDKAIATDFTMVHYATIDVDKLLNDIAKKRSEFLTKYQVSPNGAVISMEEWLALQHVYPRDCANNHATFMGIPIVASPSLKEDEIIVV